MTRIMTTTAWEVDERGLPHESPPAEQAMFLLRYAVLAPSTHNSQPWRFALDRPYEIGVYADKAHWLRISDPEQRELHVSVGCAIENLLVAADHFGFGTTVSYFPEPSNEYLVAVVTLKPGQTPALDEDLFPAIVRRRTVHQPFEDLPVPSALVGRLARASDPPHVIVATATDEALRRRLDDLLVKADAAMFARLDYRDELARSIAQGAFGTPWLLAQLERLAVAHINIGGLRARRDEATLRSAPVFGVVATRDDDHAAHVRAGQMTERIYLIATAMGLGVRPMTLVLEVPECREELNEIWAGLDGTPQLPFLVGYPCKAEEPTPRWSGEQVLL
jgi:nitroreductase